MFDPSVQRIDSLWLYTSSCCVIKTTGGHVSVTGDDVVLVLQRLPASIPLSATYRLLEPGGRGENPGCAGRSLANAGKT